VTQSTTGDRRAQILAAARSEFGARGYASGRVRDIAHAVGVTDAVIYRQFPSKRELFREVLADALRDLVSRIETMVAQFPGASRSHRYELARRTQSDLHDMFEEFAPLLGVALFHDSEDGRAFYQEMLWPALSAGAAALGGVMTERSRAAIPPEEVMIAMLGMHLAMATATSQEDAPISRQDAGDAITSSLAYGLREALLNRPA
jgi:AcrR family transcriptional regulator